MRHEPLASLDELLAPATLTFLCHEPIRTVRRAPFTGGHSASGSSFLAVETNDGDGPRFVVKLSSPECDWIVRATGDELGREVLVWASGLLDRMPPEIVHPVVACARNGSGWAILMRDVSDSLIPDATGTTLISRADHRRYLDSLAALHVAFWDDAVVAPATPAQRTCTEPPPHRPGGAKLITRMRSWAGSAGGGKHSGRWSRRTWPISCAVCLTIRVRSAPRWRAIRGQWSTATPGPPISASCASQGPAWS
jgi:hypothetical protein